MTRAHLLCTAVALVAIACSDAEDRPGPPPPSSTGTATGTGSSGGGGGGVGGVAGGQAGGGGAGNIGNTGGNGTGGLSGGFIDANCDCILATATDADCMSCDKSACDTSDPCTGECAGAATCIQGCADGNCVAGCYNAISEAGQDQLAAHFACVCEICGPSCLEKASCN